MTDQSRFGADFVAVYLLIWVRLAGVLLVAPLFGRGALSVKLRLAAAALLAAVIAPLHATSGSPAALATQLPCWILREALLGLMLGGGLLMLLSAAKMAGQWIAQAAGWSAMWVAGGGSAPSGLAQLLDLTAAAVFLAAGGHRLVLGGLLDSFQASPPGQGADPPEMAAELFQMASLSFEVALRSAAPVLLAILGSQAALGLASRTAPALNTWSIGLGLQIIVVLLAVLLSLQTSAWLSWDPLPELFRSWRQLFAAQP